VDLVVAAAGMAAKYDGRADRDEMRNSGRLGRPNRLAQFVSIGPEQPHTNFPNSFCTETQRGGDDHRKVPRPWRVGHRTSIALILADPPVCPKLTSIIYLYGRGKPKMSEVSGKIAPLRLLVIHEDDVDGPVH